VWTRAPRASAETKEQTTGHLCDPLLGCSAESRAEGGGGGEGGYVSVDPAIMIVRSPSVLLLLTCTDARRAAPSRAGEAVT
jgi:uncharacterized spore protein YtfJ